MKRDKKGRRALVAWLAVAVIVASGAVTYWYVGLGATLPQSLVKQLQPGVAFANNPERQEAPPAAFDSSATPGDTIGPQEADSVTGALPDSAARVDSLAVRDDTTAAVATLDSVLTDGNADSLVAPGSTPGVLVFDGLPRTAQLSLDGDSKQGLIHEVMPGSHLIEVKARGYESFATTILVESGDTMPVRVAMERTPQPQRTVNPCLAEPPGAEYFSSGTCYDTRPSPRKPPLVTWSGDPGTPLDPVPLLVKVASDGSPMQILRGRRQTATPRVILRAIGFVRDSLEFVPAVKNGSPIAAWARLTVQFRRIP